MNVQSLPVLGSIDAPSYGSVIRDNVVVRGWILDDSGVSKIEVLVDGKNMGEAEYGLSRLDVQNIFPEYKNANSGYQFTLNTRNLTNGQHWITVRETGKNGAVKEIQSQLVNIQNLPVKGYIDSPENGSTLKGDISVRGWIIDVSNVSKVEVLIDGKSLGEAQYGISRPDVGQAFPEYRNANSGYQFTFNSLIVSDGQHTLTIKETSGNGSTYTINTTIYIYNGNPYLQFDLRKPSNITANEIINFINSKRPDSPLKDYAQEFINAQAKYGVNAQYLVAHSILETGWGGSDLKTYKHNLFGYGAYDPCPFTCGYYFPTVQDAIDFEGYIVRRDYLNEDGKYYNGPTLPGMNVRYASDPEWANKIANLMLQMKPFDASSYFNSSILPSSPTAAPIFGRDIPAGQPFPTKTIINYTTETYAKVTTDKLSFRSIPYTMQSTLIKTLSVGTVVKVLGYNTDVKYYPGDATKYPYDNLWYRVLVNGQEGWIYGGGITFN